MLSNRISQLITLLPVSIFIKALEMVVNEVGGAHYWYIKLDFHKTGTTVISSAFVVWVFVTCMAKIVQEIGFLCAGVMHNDMPCIQKVLLFTAWSVVLNKSNASVERMKGCLTTYKEIYGCTQSIHRSEEMWKETCSSGPYLAPSTKRHVFALSPCCLNIKCPSEHSWECWA